MNKKNVAVTGDVPRASAGDMPTGRELRQEPIGAEPSILRTTCYRSNPSPINIVRESVPDFERSLKRDALRGNQVSYK